MSSLRKISRPSRWLLTAALALQLTACGTIDDIIFSSAKVDYNKNYEFDAVKTLAVACGVAPEDSPLSPDEIERVNIALARALERQGMVIVADPADADARVSWHVVTKEQSSLREYNAESYYQCWRCGPAISSSSVVTYTQGTFVVDVIDEQLSQSVWRGVIQGRLADVRNADVQQGRFDRAAREMFAKFPPGILIDGLY
jgi:hypothetical protein